MSNLTLFQRLANNQSASSAMSKSQPATKEIRLLDVRYLGWVKHRVDGQKTAFGWVDNQWGAVFALPVLHEWFGVDTRPGEAANLFNVLGIKQEATSEEIKTAYRRLVKQWHPDKCKEGDARQQFDAIQSAYKILGDSIKRQKYIAGLTMMAQSQKYSQPLTDYSDSDLLYRSPLRCGLILAEASKSGNRWNVLKILAWQDIVNSSGQILVSSWPRGGKEHREEWI